MIVRRETPADLEAIGGLLGEAAAVIDDVRHSEAWLPGFSFVAMGAEGGVMGHVVGMRGAPPGCRRWRSGPRPSPPHHRGRASGRR